VGSLYGDIALYRDPAAAAPYIDQMRAVARRLPGHFIEATPAAWLALVGRTEEAQAEMDRILPAVLTGSGPRQLGSAAMLAVVAARTGDVSAGARLR
jgi:hypothetical protein